MLKKIVFVCLVFIVGSYLAGCSKKQAEMEEPQEPMSMESLSAVNATNQTTTAAAPEVKSSTATTQGGVAVAPNLKVLPPSGPYKPSITEIQTALKNAGYYTGNIDGKSGPMTKKAVADFQKANNLQADGRVGPKTWVLLSAYLKSAAPKEPLKKKR